MRASAVCGSIPNSLDIRARLQSARKGSCDNFNDLVVISRLSPGIIRSGTSLAVTTGPSVESGLPMRAHHDIHVGAPNTSRGFMP